MKSTPLTAISPLDGRYSQKLSDLQPLFSEYGLIQQRLEIEVRWLEKLADTPEIDDIAPFTPAATQQLQQILKDFNVDQAERIKQIEQTTQHDLKAIEYYLKEQFALHIELQPYTELIHFGCTSEDINNLAYALLLKKARQESILPAMDALIDFIAELSERYARVAMLARTHGQPATPTTLGKELANFVARLWRQRDQLAQSPLLGKINGATGNFNAHYIAYPDVNWNKIAEQFVTSLGLEWNPYTTQIEPHDFIAEFLLILVRFNNILTDFVRDLWGYIAINYFKQQVAAGQVGSSTMPYKVNPIDFENAEGNLGLSNSLLLHLANKLPISRWQRDLSDSTALRSMGSAIAYALLAYRMCLQGLNKLAINSQQIEADLSSNWEILAEAIQTVLRRYGRRYGIDKPYERLKQLTQGKVVNKDSLREFINNLSLPEKAKQELLKLTPQTYIGIAAELTDDLIKSYRQHRHKQN